MVARLLLVEITAAAGLGAAAPVAAHPACGGRKQALAGNGKTQGPVDKVLQLDGALPADSSDLGQG